MAAVRPRRGRAELSGLDLAAAAVAENAQWCALVCQAHGVESETSGAVWTARGAPPPYYPDVITLAPGVPPAAVDAAARPGAAVKDSYADVPLGAGYRKLFGAAWIAHPPVAGDRGPWSVVESAEELLRWRERHGAADALVPGLLRDPDVAVLARHDDDRVTAGAIAHRGADVTGLSNVFGLDPWDGLAAAAAASFGARPLVGYERGIELPAAVAAGFSVTGPLRVWLRAV